MDRQRSTSAGGIPLRTMKAFLALPTARRRNAFLQVDEEMGLQAFKDLQSACRDWVQGDLRRALRRRIAGELGPDGWSLEVDSSAADGQ